MDLMQVEGQDYFNMFLRLCVKSIGMKINFSSEVRGSSFMKLINYLGVTLGQVFPAEKNIKKMKMGDRLSLYAF